MKKEIKTGSDHLNKYEKELRKKKASACLKKLTSQKKEEDLNHKFINKFQKASEKVNK